MTEEIEKPTPGTLQMVSFPFPSSRHLATRSVHLTVILVVVINVLKT